MSEPEAVPTPPENTFTVVFEASATVTKATPDEGENA